MDFHFSPTIIHTLPISRLVDSCKQWLRFEASELLSQKPRNYQVKTLAFQRRLDFRIMSSQYFALLHFQKYFQNKATLSRLSITSMAVSAGRHSLNKLD